MAHKVKIDGADYEITGGKTLVDGTAYDVEHGKISIDNTKYDVSWLPIITVVGNPTFDIFPEAVVRVPQDDGTSIAMLNGKTFLPKGAIIRCSVGAWVGLTAKVIKNGETVLSYTNDGSGMQIFIPTVSYEYVVTGNATIECETIDTGTGDKDTYGIITITEH